MTEWTQQIRILYQPGQWLLLFYLYSVIGWIWECCYVRFASGRWENRGFMKGPMLPLYGSGAICILMVTVSLRDHPVLLVLFSIIACSAMEYATGAAMEWMFHVRYWDYSHKPMNINGYICLEATLLWGFLAFALVYWIQPAVDRVLLQIPYRPLLATEFVITCVATADYATSFKAAVDLREILEKAESLSEELGGIRARMEQLQSAMTDAAVTARELTMETVLTAKDLAKEAAVVAKDKTVETAIAAKDKTVETAIEAMDKTVETAIAAKDKTVETAIAAKNKTVETAIAAKDKTMETAAAARDITTELIELRLREQLSLQKIRAGYTRSVSALLRRNPSAVSDRHGEVFTRVKKRIGESEKEGQQDQFNQ